MRIFVLALIASALAAQDVKLWPNGSAEPEVSLPSDDPRYPKKFTVVHQPSIYPFLPPKGTATGVALIIAPGGGHSQLVIDKEGWDIAKWANAHGMAAFVLKYRLARAPGSKYTVEHDALVFPDGRRLPLEEGNLRIDWTTSVFESDPAGGVLLRLPEKTHGGKGESQPFSVLH